MEAAGLDRRESGGVSRVTVVAADESVAGRGSVRAAAGKASVQALPEPTSQKQ